MALGLRDASDDPTIAMVRHTLAQPGLLGVAFTSEAWSRECSPEERSRLGDTSLADVPGSQEVRFTLAALKDGSERRIVRFRGERPMVGSVDDVTSDGALIAALGVIVSAVAGLPLPDVGDVIPFRWVRR